MITRPPIMRARVRTMNDPTARRLTALDAIFIVSACGLGAFWASQTIPILVHLATSDFNGPFMELKFATYSSFAYDSVLLRRSLHAFAAFLAPPTVALLVLRFRRPRPPIRRCFRQPGALACGAAAMCLCLEVVNHFLNLTIRFNTTRLSNDLSARYLLFAPKMSHASILGAVAFGMGETPGLAVAGAYLALRAAGLWRSERSWLDRSGRALGWLWIILALAFAVLPLID